MRAYKEGAKVTRDEIYILDPASIDVGDIVLSTDELSPTGELIKVTTGGEYSHAAICTDVGLVVEASFSAMKDPGAVQRSSIMRIAVSDPKFVRVLRLKQTVLDRKSKAEQAAAFAEFMISREYWWDGVKKFLLPGIPANERGRFFCSHLVADAYRRAGVELLPDTTSEKTAPGDFLTSRSLQDVTLQALRIEKESVVREHLPQPDESIHLDIEVKLQQALLNDPRLHAIAKRLRSPTPRSYFDELLPLLAKTRDAELDALIAATEEEMGEQVKHAVQRYAVTEEQVRLLRDALASKALSDAEVQARLNMVKYEKHIADADLVKRRRDVGQNSILFHKSKLRTFYQRWATSLKYLRFMEHQSTLLEKQLALFEQYK